jgi:hypothetical protein
VSPRKNKDRRAVRPEPAELDRSFGFQRAVSADDGEWIVRSVTGEASGKSYRCPGCDHEVRPGTPHIVAWPAASEYGSGGGGLDHRRHWHTPCWNARDRRHRR